MRSPRVNVRSLLFSDGSSVEFGACDVVVIVGPNNSGKSAALRSVRDKLNQAAKASPVVNEMTIDKHGDDSLLSEWVESWTVKQANSQPDNPIYQAMGKGFAKSGISQVWVRDGHELGELSRWFCHLLGADERLNICKPAQNIVMSRDNPSHPIHFLFKDDVLEQRISDRFKKAFGFDIVVNRGAGSVIPLHVGERPDASPDEDRISYKYIKKLECLPLLHEQGDGMRSFAGVLLATSVGRESILLIDEPEAFLHPPQARYLGEIIVQERQDNQQLFIATHSSDILRGILNAESQDVQVVRLVREGDINTVTRLDNSRVKELWGDSLLRYSNILDGLFHEKVVICESDSDCRFYSAVLDAVVSVNGGSIKRPDIMFTHCGGKSRLPVVIKSLREVDVPVVAVADFDIFSDEDTLRKVVISLGMDWENLKKDWKIFKTEVDNKKPDLKTHDVKSEIEKLLGGIETEILPRKVKNDIQHILRRSSAWSYAKSVGKAFVPSGQASQACERLLTRLRGGGLHVVEVGELEGFVRTEGSHGPKWVNEVLRRPLATDPELECARQFVRRLLS